MAVELEPLVERLESSLTAPGSPSLFQFTTAETDSWIASLAHAFWTARLRGLFADYRVADGEIHNIAGGPNLTDPEQQVIVLMAAFNAIEARLLALTNTKYKAGPLEAETAYPLTILKDILDARRAELDEIRLEQGGTSGSSTTVAFIDLAAARHAQISDAYTHWIN